MVDIATFDRWALEDIEKRASNWRPSHMGSVGARGTAPTVEILRDRLPERGPVSRAETAETECGDWRRLVYLRNRELGELEAERDSYRDTAAGYRQALIQIRDLAPRPLSRIIASVLTGGSVAKVAATSATAEPRWEGSA